jgi:hypothetical protein
LTDIKRVMCGRRIDRLARIIFGFCGAISLLVPLVVLTFIDNNYSRILATVLFVVAFVLLLAFFSEANNQELIAATAGYTAVLVVFLGASTTGV